MDTEDNVVMARDKVGWRLGVRTERGGNGDVSHNVNSKTERKKN